MGWSTTHSRLRWTTSDAFPLNRRSISSNAQAIRALKDLTGKTASDLVGLVSCAEWTGVRLKHVLQEAGVQHGAKWVVAEGADAAALTRSIPLEKCLDDAMLVYSQNGERLRPQQGYPLRLLLPGFEGNMSVKWLRRTPRSGRAGLFARGNVEIHRSHARR